MARKVRMASGTVTQANMRLSGVNGTSFVDFSAADVLTTKLGNLLKVRDSAGRAIQGWIKAAGAGESKEAAKSVVGITKANPGVVTFGAGHGYANGDLIYFSGLTEMTSLNGAYRTLEGNSGDTFTIGNTSTYEAAETTGGNCAERVVVPEATGVTIVSSKGGGTYNWAQRDAAFDWNSASFTYEIYKVLTAPVVLSTDVLANQLLMDSTTANAMINPVGVDLSAYQVGGYWALGYQAGVLTWWGKVKAEAPGGEGLSGELVDAWTNHATNTYETWTPGAGNLITQAVNTTGHGAAYKSGLTLAGKLLKNTNAITKTSGTNPTIGGGANSVDSAFTFDLNSTSYRTGTTGAILLNCYVVSASTDFALTNYTTKQVTECAATGLHLAGSDGVTRGFVKAPTAGTENLATTVKIVYVGD